MTDVLCKSILSISILASGTCIAFYAHDVNRLWTIWLLTTGFFVGSALAPSMTTFATSICILSLLAISASLIVRRLPIHKLDWAGVDRIEISSLDSNWKVVLTDPQEIATLMSYGKSGHYASILKSGSLIHMYVTHDNTTTGYYVHGNSVGSLPGGMAQTVFVPRRDGLQTDLRKILARHG